MSVGITIDPFALGIDALELQNPDEGKDSQIVEQPDKWGSIVKAEAYDHISSPKAPYAIVGEFDASAIKLGDAKNGNVITSFAIQTAAGQVPKFDVGGESMAEGTPVKDGRLFTTPAQALGPENRAYALFGAPDSSGNIHLQSCSANGSCQLVRTTGKDGKTKKYGITNGRIEVSAEYISSDGSLPVAPEEAANLVVKTHPSKSQEGTGYTKVSLAFTLYLAATA